MAIYHVDVHCLSKGTRSGGHFARYLCREEALPGMRHSQYLVREGRDAHDLTACGYGGLPPWARDGVHFFEQADRWERRNATVARGFQISLPRELSAEARLALADDLRATFFEQYPHVWAVHTPCASDGREQPHLHVVLSERRCLDGYTRGPKEYFARAANREEDARAGGVRKDRSWVGIGRLRNFRAEVALMLNAALDREGLAVAVSHVSLRQRDLDREPEHFERPPTTKGSHTQESWEAKLDQRNLRQREYYPWENEINLAAWHEQKQREGIRDLSREAIVDHVRDRFWRHDHSPAREQERAESFNRAIDREWAHTGRALWHRHEPIIERTQARQRSERGVRMVEGQEDRMHGGVHVEIDTHEREVTHG
jgi:MobA/MobL family